MTEAPVGILLPLSQDYLVKRVKLRYIKDTDLISGWEIQSTDRPSPSIQMAVNNKFISVWLLVELINFALEEN